MKININDLIKKAEEAKAIEFFLEIVTFLKEVKPVLVLMNSTIVDGTAKLPTASKKLSKVTEATEVATTEIMNLLDQVYANVNKIRNTNSDSESLDNIENDLNSIMMALQVQDITSQQIAAVNHMLNLLHNKLNQLLLHFDEEYIKQLLNVDLKEFHSEDNVSTLHREIAFDPDAINSITNNINRQELIDDLINKAALGEEISYGNNELIIENDSFSIEDLFKNAQIENQSKNLSSSDDKDEAIDSVDIDALFNNANSISSEEMSLDDIDALFNSN